MYLSVKYDKWRTLKSDTNVVYDKAIRMYVELYLLFKSKQISSNTKLAPENNLSNRGNKFFEILVRI